MIERERTPLTVVPDDPQGREARGPLRLYEELVRLAAGASHVTVQNETLALSLHVEIRTVQRWKKALRAIQPPVVQVTKGTHYRLRMDLAGAYEVIEGSDITAREAITHDHPDTITPDHPLVSIRARERSTTTTTTTATTTSDDSHPDHPTTITSEGITPMSSLDASHLTVNALLRAAGVDDTEEACEALEALPRARQVAVLDYTRANARRPNPDFVVRVAENEAAGIRAEAYGPWEEFRAAWLGEEFEAGDEMSLREPVAREVPTSPAAAQTSTTDPRATRGHVRGSTPRAGSNLLLRAATVLVTAGRLLERWAR